MKKPTSSPRVQLPGLRGSDRRSIRKTIKILFLVLILFTTSQASKAEETLSQRLSGRILLQVQQNGEAWYVYPDDLRRYYLGRPSDAFEIMRNLGLGVNRSDLDKIPPGLINYDGEDTDNDGLVDKFEGAMGLDSQNSDSDGDGYSDYEEIKNGYNPSGKGDLSIDEDFFSRHKGRIFLDTSRDGQAWYLDPIRKKRYYLNKPEDAFAVMRSLSLGITDRNLALINIGKIQENEKEKEDNFCSTCRAETPREALEGVAYGFSNKNLAIVKNYFTADYHLALEKSFEIQPHETFKDLADLLSIANLKEKTAERAVYHSYVVFPAISSKNAELIFEVKKEEDGVWRMQNL